MNLNLIQSYKTVKFTSIYKLLRDLISLVDMEFPTSFNTLTHIQTLPYLYGTNFIKINCHTILKK